MAQFPTIATLNAAPQAEQRAYWAALLDSWAGNASREHDADAAFDAAPERECWQ